MRQRGADFFRLKAIFILMLAAATAAITPTSALASITFVASSPLADSSAPVTTVTVSLPTGVQSGDTLLAQIIVWDGSGSDVPTSPSGWIVIRHDAVSNANRITSWLYYKVAGASEPASYGWRISSQWAAGVMGAWRGAALSPLDNASGATAAGGSPLSGAAPSLTPSADGELQLYFYACQSSSGPTITLPGAIVPRLNIISSKEGFTVGLGDLAAPSAGIASPTYVATATIAGGTPVMTAQAVLLIPASQSATATPTATLTAIATSTATPTAIATPTATATAIATPTATVTAVATATSTPTSVATGTATSTATATTTPTPAPGSISFVAVSALADFSAPVTTVTIGVPTGVQSGDTLLAQVVVYDATGSNVPTPPNGWTTIRHDTASNGNRITSWLYYKVAGASEPVSYAWNISSQWAAGEMGAWRNAFPSMIDGASGTAVGGPSPLSGSAPSLTPSYDGELQVYFYGSQGSTGPAITLPAALTRRQDVVSSKEGFTLGLGDLDAPSAGTASPTYVATATIAGGAPVMSAQAILLIPASQTGIPTPTATASATATVSPTATVTATRTATASRTATPTATRTATLSATPTVTATRTTTATATPTTSATPTATSTAPTPTATATVFVPTDVLTYHNDNGRTGQNLTEQILTTTNVNSTLFGKVLELSVDGKVDAQPLIKTQVTIPGKGLHNVLYVVTEHDSVYAFDADNGVLLWPSKLSMLATGEVPSDSRGCGQVTPEIGITSTPVIDPSAGPNGTIYLVAMSKNTSTTPVSYFQRIHALDLTTGAEEFGGPVTVTATVPGTGAGSQSGQVPFTPANYKERAGLLLINGTVYTTWASHCDISPYTGWIISYAVNAQNTLARSSFLNIIPNGNDGAIWQAGAGPAADNLGNIYFLDANGTFDTTLTMTGMPNNGDFGNAFMKLSTSGGLSVADYFEMSNTVSESSADIDLGSGGAMLLPDMIDVNSITRHLAVGAGKDHNIYMVDRDNMGKFNAAGNTNLYQELPGALPSGIFAMPAYFNNTLYYGGVNAPLRAFGFSNALIVTSSSSNTATSFGSPGTTPSISANGLSNGIVWAIQNASGGVLHAYDASNLANELYNSNQATNGRDSFSDNKFVTPTIANGKVYVGTPNSVAIFGLLP